MQSELSFGGALSARVNRAEYPIGYRVRNVLRWGYLWGWLTYHLAHLFSAITGIPCLVGRLEGMLVRADGTKVQLGTLGFRVVTSAGVGFLVDDWDDDTTDITTMNYHACGTDNTAENSSDTALGSEATAVTDRATGTKSQPSANVLQSVGTQSFTGTAAIVEHGLFSSGTEGSGTLWDRTVFSAVNVGNGDSIAWTYQCTLTAGS